MLLKKNRDKSSVKKLDMKKKQYLCGLNLRGVSKWR
jgi:hypothetical protein